MENQNLPWEEPIPQPPKQVILPTDNPEMIFSLLILVMGCLLCNSMFHGLHLGFSLFSGVLILCSTGYLLNRGCKLTLYSGTLLGLSLVICTAFARGDDGFVKFILLCFLIVSVNLGLCLLAGQNRRVPNGVTSLLDAPRTVFMLGLGYLPKSCRGLRHCVKNSGSVGKNGSAILLGLVIAVPLLALLVSLLIGADAAFDALLKKLPEFHLDELLLTLFFGIPFSAFLYSRSTALRHAPKSAPVQANRKGISPLTVNTVLIAVALVYGVYLVSQLAYFSGGFLGILPEGYTAAEYARRGFFEMAWLCAINLAVMALSIGLVAKQAKAPLLTRLICLFLGVMTLFLVVSASAKMFLYIGSFGLTRLRVLTQVIIFFLGLCTVFVSIWLFAPKMPYMKAVLIAALIMGAVVAWADVDTVVAAYNVDAYQTGKLQSVDIDYLGELGHGAIPYLAELAESSDPKIAKAARRELTYQTFDPVQDFRSWNYASSLAETCVIVTEPPK